MGRANSKLEAAVKEMFFISGLPRSGSTLLSAILKQNPDVYADISSPVEEMVSTSISVMSASESNQLIKEDKRKAILTGLVESYYSDVDRPIVFDTSRGWTAKTGVLKDLFPHTKIICCVRDLFWITVKSRYDYAC